MSISRIFNDWYLENKRDLPWRNTENSYYIWVSEIILQQTKVSQGLEYFKRFINAFPDIQSLANAEPDEVLKLWQGLGYYTRARNIHLGAKYVMQHYKGSLPSSYNELLSIHGIGKYTASAIASIAFGLPYPVIDGNVNRVISRIFGITDPVNSALGEKKIYNLAMDLIDKTSPGLHNQAIMEFGALQCTPVKPDCKFCPLVSVCVAFQNNLVEQIPYKIKKGPLRLRYFYYLIVYYKDGVYLRKRDANDIWKGLYEFPLIETNEIVDTGKLILTNDWIKLFYDNTINILSESEVFFHKLTHQTINCIFIKVRINKPFSDTNQFERINLNMVNKFPVSRLIEKFISENGL